MILHSIPLFAPAISSLALDLYVKSTYRIVTDLEVYFYRSFSRRISLE